MTDGAFLECDVLLLFSLGIGQGFGVPGAMQALQSIKLAPTVGSAYRDTDAATALWACVLDGQIASEHRHRGALTVEKRPFFKSNSKRTSPVGRLRVEAYPATSAHIFRIRNHRTSRQPGAKQYTTEYGTRRIRQTRIRNNPGISGKRPRSIPPVYPESRHSIRRTNLPWRREIRIAGDMNDWKTKDRPSKRLAFHCK